MKALLAPVFAQVLLTVVLMWAMAIARTRALRRRDVRMADVSLGQQAWPPRVTLIGNAFHNQLQMPLFLYLGVLFAIVTGAAAPPTSALIATAWAFVGFRVVHASIHVTTNRVPYRFVAFALGNLCLVALWVQIAVHVYG